VDWHMLVSLLAGSLPAVAASSVLARKFPARWLQIALSLVLMTAAAKTLTAT